MSILLHNIRTTVKSLKKERNVDQLSHKTFVDNGRQSQRQCHKMNNFFEGLKNLLSINFLYVYRWFLIFFHLIVKINTYKVPACFEENNY